MKVGYAYDPIYLKHDTGNHPESISRLETIISHLKETRLIEKLTPIKPRPAIVEELSQVHSKELISEVQDVARKGGGWLDPDTVVSASSYDAALYAAGGLIEAAKAVLNGEVSSAFGLVRPPGHHATKNNSMGFCLFNNIAVAARYVLNNYDIQKIAIIDFDVHHGNGTQEAFYSEPSVLYISTHQSPYYPGTGSIEETGKGEAKGTTVNIPLLPGCGDSEYEQVFEKIVVPVTKRYRPQLIMVSAGYDLHWADQLAMMQVSTTGFAHMTGIIKELADELCGGRMVFTLEGGYNLTALSTSVKATFDVLMGKSEITDQMGKPNQSSGPPPIEQVIRKVKEVHSLT